MVAAALCYYRDAPEPGPTRGGLPRYTWRDEYAELRERLDALGRRLGGSYRVLVDENDHVDRAAAVRAGIAFYGKNTMAITRRHGSWVVLGVLVTDVEVEPSPPLELDCGECRLCIDACPTGALDEPGTLDATKCLSYWTQAPGVRSRGVPRRAGRHGVRLRHLPGRLPVEPGRREAASRGGGRRAVRRPRSLADWLERDGVELVAEFDRLYVPRNDPRWLRRNALVAAGNVGTRSGRPCAGTRDDSDPVLATTAEWALERMAERAR